MILGLAIAGPDAFAQEQRFLEGELGIRYTIDSVAVTATRMPVALHAGARAVTVMDSKDIEAAPVQTVNDLLKYAVGVDVRQRGAFGMQTDISMRGGTYNQVAVLLNGINITDPQTGHNSFDFPVSLSDIDHIEVVEGPAARVYGTSAMVGAINIVTKGHIRDESNPRHEREIGSFEMGSFCYISSNASFSISGKRNFHLFSTGYSRSKGYSRNSAGDPNSDFEANKVFYQGGHQWKKRDLTWQFGTSYKDFGSSTFYSPKYDNQFEHTLKTFAAVKSEGRGKWHITPSIYWNYSQDRFELFRGEPDKYPFNYHKTKVTGANLNSYIDSRFGRTAFGAEARHEAIRSTNLGEILDKPKGRYVCGLGRTGYNVFVDHKVNLGRFGLSGGITAAYNTGNTEGVKFFPGAEVSFRLSDEGSIYASYNSSYRMPTFTDLYYSVGGHLADPNLKAEKLNALEAGLKFSVGGLKINAAVFAHRGYDMIDWIMDTSAGEDAPWTSMNHTMIGTIGQEGSVLLNLSEMLHRPDFFVQNISFAALHMEQSKDLEEHLRSLYSMEYIRSKLNSQVDFALPLGITANVAYTYVDRATESELIKPYHLLDAKISYILRERVAFYIRANNILNRPYYDFGDIPQPGLWIIGGISFGIY